MSNSLNTQWGALSFPIPPGDGNDLTKLDPARDIILDLLEAALNSELSDAWNAVCVPLGMPSPVRSKMPGLDDLDTIRQCYGEPPWLSVARSLEPATSDEFTLWQNRITSKWTIDYVLGALEIGDQWKLTDVLIAAGKIIDATVNNGGHKAYATTTRSDGSLQAKQVFFLGGCGFNTVFITSFTLGSAAFSQGGPKYHALTMTLQSTELDSMEAETNSYAGSSVQLNNPASGTRTDAVSDLDTAIAVQPPNPPDPTP